MRAGVGEVIARGPNVMVGYFGNEEATRRRWSIAGSTRATWAVWMTTAICIWSAARKTSSSTPNGKNVYPDEVEEVYQDSPYIKELSVIGLPDGIGEKGRVHRRAGSTNTTLRFRAPSCVRKSKSTSARSRPRCLITSA